MFDKEAESYVKAFTDRSHIWSNDKLMQLTLRQAFKDGAKFGYNKADERFTKANEIIEGLMRFCRCFAQHHTDDIRYKEAEQFLREQEKW